MPACPTTRLIHLLNGALLAGFLLGSLALWDHVPARIPIHFGLAGDPNVWTEKTAWFALPALALAVTGFFYAVSITSRDDPWSWNLPGTERILQLSPGERVPLAAMLQQAIAWTTTLMIVMFIGAQVAVYQVAVGRATDIPWYIAGLGAFAIAGMVLIQFALRRKVRRYLVERPPVSEKDLRPDSA